MANVQRTWGARPVRYKNGSPWTGAATHYYVPASYGTAIFIGDPVVIIGEANTSEINGFAVGSLPTVNLGAAGAAITGFVVGRIPATRDTNIYKPASSEAVLLVADDPSLVFQIVGDGGATSGWDEFPGFNATLIAGTGNTTTGLSGWAMDEGTSTAPRATNTDALFILSMSNIMNNALGKYAVWDVMLNQQTFAPSLGLGIA